MKMIPGGPASTIEDYGSYIHNCTERQMPYRVPVSSLADVQLYIPIGGQMPSTAFYQIIKTCGGSSCFNYAISNTVIGPLLRLYSYTDCSGNHVDAIIGGLTTGTEQNICAQEGSVSGDPNLLIVKGAACSVETIVPINYVIGQDTNENWYGVFKGFAGSAPACFVIAITVDDQIYYSEEYCIANACETLTLIKGCYGNLANKLSYDCEGVYFGTHATDNDSFGDITLVYKHELYLRGVEVTMQAIKNTFKQGRTRNFRTEKEKVYQFWGELLPEWYMPEVDAVFYRGEVFVGDTKYLVNDTQFEKVEDCKKMWKPTATFKQSCYQSFSCETDPCNPPPEESGGSGSGESGSGEESGSGSGSGGGSGIAVSVRVGNTFETHCSLGAITAYTDDGTIATGKTVYTDIAMTSPLLGNDFISDLSSGVIFNMDSGTGVVGLNTGFSC